MKVLILAGGKGTRLSEPGAEIPKPMVQIGGIPIIVHIMKIYSYYGFNDFILLLGHKGYLIKEYFKNYLWHQNDVTIDLQNNSFTFHNKKNENWKITLLDTGEETMTGSRILKAKDFIDEERFMVTYGDGVSDVKINDILKFHLKHSKVATMTSVQPDGRFGSFEEQDGLVTSFLEKPKGDGSWINGGFFIFEKSFFDYVKDDENSILEEEPLPNLAIDRQLMTFKHKGFWKCMDTMKDKVELENIWKSKNAPWKIW